MNFDPTSALIGQFDHIVLHNDGNNNDPDDIAAVPIEAALIKAAGLEDKATIFYNNNLGEPNNPSMVAKMRESAAFAEELGIQTHDYQANIDQATEELVKILSSGQKVLAIEGGPMEAIYRGLEQVSPENRANLTLLSHSSWNEDRDVTTKSGVNDVRTWEDIRQDFPSVKLVEIQDQNGNPNGPGFNTSQWNWLNNTDNPVLQDARIAMNRAGGEKSNDPSDAGMLFYALTGNETANPQDAKDFFEEFLDSSGTPTPEPDVPDPDNNSDNDIYLAENGQVVIEAENTDLEGDWEAVTVEGKQSVLWDPDQNSYDRVPDGQTLSYLFETDESGQYSIALNSARRKSVMNDSDLFENGQPRTDTGNDVYVSVVDQSTGEVIQNPTKLFTGLGDSDGELKWGDTFDTNDKKSAAEVTLKEKTQYRLEITGRSDGYVLDRITLSNDGALKDTSVPESEIKGGSPNPEPPAPEPNEIEGTGGNDTLLGANTDDLIKGFSGDDLIRGRTGKDIVVGANGDDTLFGGDGRDKAYAGAGDDVLYGGRGNDRLAGGEGNDNITGGSGRDTLVGVFASDDTPGVGEVDTLSGAQDGDMFILGDASNVYYAGDAAEDYALITDFDLAEGDMLQLKGEASDYSLGAASQGLPSGTAITYQGGSNDEIIAIVQGTSNFELDDSSVVQYV